MSKARDLADSVSTGGILEDGAVSVSEISDLTVTAAELNNVAGVNSDVQTQLDLKAPLASPTFTGTVGIGTGSPEAPLEIQKGSNGEYLRIGGDDVPQSSDSRGLRFTSSSVSSYVGAAHDINAPSSQGVISFSTNSTEAMRIDNSGNVGVGNTNPTIKLDVQDTSGVIGRIQSTSGDAQFNIAVPNANDGILAFGDASSYRASIKANTSDAITFQTGSSLTERFRFGSSGELGIGGATYGTAGQVLTSGGSGAAPTWADAAGGSTLEATADGTIADGKACIIQADGTVKQVGSTVQTNNPASTSSNLDNFDSGNTVQNTLVIAVPNTNYIVYFYRDNDNSGVGKCTVGTVDSATGTISSWTTPVQWRGDPVLELDGVYDSSTGGFFIVWADTANGPRDGKIMHIKLNYSTGAIIENPVVTFWSSYAENMRIAHDNNGRGVIFMRYQQNNQGYVVSYKFVDSTNTFSFSDYNINAGTTLDFDIGYDANTDRYVAVYRDNSDSEQGTARAIQMDASPSYGLSFGSEVHYDTNTSDWNRIEYDASAQKLIIAWREEDSTSSPYSFIFKLCTVSINTGSNDLTFGTVTSVNFGQGGGTQYIQMAYNPDAQGMGIVFRDNSNSQLGGFYFATTSGSTISLDTKATFASGTTAYPYSLTYSEGQEAFVTAWNDSTGAYGKLTIIQKTETVTNLTDENFVGLSDNAYTNGQTATIQLVGSVDDAQTGLTAGQKYYVQGDGTLGLTPVADLSVYAGLAVASDKIIVKG